MEHHFTIGYQEQHAVSIYYDRFWGKFEICVDGYTAIHQWLIFGFELTRSFPLWIGVNEKHYLVVQKTRPLLMPYLQPHTYRIWIDHVLVHEFQA